jgi:hypothetical protein
LPPASADRDSKAKPEPHYSWAADPHTHGVPCFQEGKSMADIYRIGVRIAMTSNRWLNLRNTDRFGNAQNQRRRPDNKTGTKGVYWDTRRCKWMVCIRARKKTYRKRFSGIGDARAYAASLRAELHQEFARTH